MKKILIFGATGFIGKALVNQLCENYHIHVISRNHVKAEKLFPENVSILDWNYKDILKLAEIISGFDVVINLAGENIASGLWTKKQKQKILDSRISLGKSISAAMIKAEKKPNLLIQASAIGYYGYNVNHRCDENTPKGNGFLAYVTDQWEKSTEDVTQHGIRRAVIRTGVVLGKNGGMFPKLIKPIKMYLGSNFGKGENWLSWIHIVDEIRAIEFIMNDQSASGIYNLVASKPVQSKQLNKTIGKLLNKPIWFNIPKGLLKLLLGDMAKELLFSSQKVEPRNLIQSGFEFQYSDIEDAVQSIIKEKAT